MNLNHIKKLMDRKKNSQKGENGSALIIAGSEDFAGAATLAGLAALRASCDEVTVAAPEKVAWAINAYSPDLITHKVRGTNFNIKNAREMIKFASKFDAVLIGNGLTRRADRFSQQFIKKCPLLKVVDEDALGSLSFKDFTNSIVMPNWEELELMLANSKKEFLLPKLRAGNAKERADILQGNLRYFLQNNNVLVVKGATDIIISRNKISYNRTGNQGMTKNGTGDIMAGLALGFLAKSRDLFKSAVAASFINGYVGDLLLKKKKGYSFIASDILEDLDKVQGMKKKVAKKKASDVKAKEKAKAQKAAVKKPAKKPAKRKK